MPETKRSLLSQIVASHRFLDRTLDSFWYSVCLFFSYLIQKKRSTSDSGAEPNKHHRKPDHNGDSTMGESPLDPSEQQKEITCNVKRDWIDKATILFEGIGLFTLIIYAVFTIKIWCANKHAADAAASAAATAAKQFESQERPWLSIRVSLAGSFILDEYYATLPTLVTLKNTGHTPAIRVLINPEFFPMPPSVAKERERLCEQTKLQLTANPNMGDVIFPDSNDFVKQENITINRDTLLKAVRENHDSVLPVAIYCVAYASTFDKTPHVSAAAFEVRHYDAKTNNTLAIFPEQTPILRPEELRLYYTQESPTYAD